MSSVETRIERISQNLLAFESSADNPPAPLVTGHNDLGSLAFTHGLPDRFKSWHAYTKALCVASGRKFLGEYNVTQGPVVLWVEEGAHWRIAQRIRRFRPVSGSPTRTRPSYRFASSSFAA